MSAADIVSTVQRLTAKYGQAPSCSDVALELGYSAKRVREVVADLIEADVLCRVGSGPTTGLAIVEPLHSPEVRKVIEGFRALGVAQQVQAALALAALRGEVSHG